MLFKTYTHAYVSVTDEMNEDESISTTSSMKRPAEVSCLSHVSALCVLCTCIYIIVSTSHLDTQTLKKYLIFYKEFLISIASL